MREEMRLAAEQEEKERLAYEREMQIQEAIRIEEEKRMGLYEKEKEENKVDKDYKMMKNGLNVIYYMCQFFNLSN